MFARTKFANISKLNKQFKGNLKKRLISFVLLGSLLFNSTACHKQANAQANLKFDDYGANLALKIAKLGARPGGSSAEKTASDLIANEFKELGYSPEIQSFSANGVNSQNIIVNIPGFGMSYQTNELSKARFVALGEHIGNTRKTALVIARYNTVPKDEVTQADGLSDNAAGVAALLALARQLKYEQVGYDLILAAVGAGNNDFAGSRALLEHLGNEQKARIDCVYEIRNIFGGSKLYAHSGWNSLNPEEKYWRRLPTYQLIDVALEEGLGGKSEFDSIYTNQASFLINSPLNTGKQVPYREFSLNESDYRVFDEAGLNTVYIESWNYAGKNADELKQTDNLQFSDTNGLISGTNYDNSSELIRILGQKQLAKRINSTAYILLKGLLKGEIGSHVLKANY